MNRSFYPHLSRELVSPVCGIFIQICPSGLILSAFLSFYFSKRAVSYFENKSLEVIYVVIFSCWWRLIFLCFLPSVNITRPYYWVSREFIKSSYISTWELRLWLRTGTFHRCSVDLGTVTNMYKIIQTNIISYKD